MLTWNEEANIGECLASLAAQSDPDFEVIVVDAASTDRTLEIVEAARRGFPQPLRLEAANRRIPIGQARNLGHARSTAPFVAFVSADAALGPNWTREAIRSLATHDLVFGRQVHDPHRWTTGAAVRGLRYHFPSGETADPLPYASNVAAAYRREVLGAHPFEDAANAAEDLLLAKRAHAEGRRVAYNPRMVVRHHDVATARGELRKNLREGRGWARYRQELGLFLPLLAWGAALLVAAALLAVRPGWVTISLLVLLLWLPAVRRALRQRHAMPALRLVQGVLASPPFDVAFLLSYLAGLLGRRPAHAGSPGPQRIP